MFESVVRKRDLPEEEYRARVPALREELLEAQFELAGADFPVIVLFAGVDGAGKGETANLLNWWMDPRRIVTRAFDRPSESEAARPEFWRFWRALPPRGHIGVLLRAWYSKPLLQRVQDVTDDDAFDRDLDRIVEFERMLVDDGALLVKFWMHLGREAQANRFRALEADPDQAWKVTPLDWQHYGMYDRFISASERLVEGTNWPGAEWMIIDGSGPRARALEVGSVLLDRIKRGLAGEDPGRSKGARKGRDARRKARRTARARSGGEVDADAARAFDDLDMTRVLSRAEYGEAVEHWQGRLNRLARAAARHGLSSILVFEGWDAAGKGGAIRRLTGALDARWYRVIPIGAPNDEEAARHYLWRFWRHLPPAGRFIIFDRSWYGRVLVERVEGFASKHEWKRAYDELNAFERQLTDHGMMVLKFWMHISDDEQARRFEERADTPHKRWKLTEEDWRNRSRRADYERAVRDMVARTHTRSAPWMVVEANDKRFARIRVLKEVCDRLSGLLGRNGV